MEGFLETLGIVGLAVLVIVGLLAGWFASLLGTGSTVGYMVIGVVGALALPFLLVLVGAGVLAAYGILAIVVAALIGAVVVLFIAHLFFGDRA